MIDDVVDRSTTMTARPSGPSCWCRDRAHRRRLAGRDRGLEGRSLRDPSLLGYGRTAERRTADDPLHFSRGRDPGAVIRRTVGPVHLVGTRSAAWCALSWHAQPGSLASLAIVEAPAVELLRETTSISTIARSVG